MDRNIFFAPPEWPPPIMVKKHPERANNACKKRNCLTIGDFQTQSEILKEHFIEKGYDPQRLDVVINEIKEMPREECLRNTLVTRTSTDHEWSFISSFHSQCKEVEAIFKAHWHFLSLDKTLKPVLILVPKFIYRKAPKVVKRILDPPSRLPSFWDKDGFCCCGKFY